jgi:N-methylhydantoinase B
MSTTSTLARGTLDPVSIQVIRNSFVAAADEMKITMIKTAYNDLLIEVQDFGCVITDERGELLAQSDTLPVFLSVLPGCIRTGLERYGAAGFADGDVVLANDPYTTGTHISDTAIYMPIIDGGDLLGFVGCMAHWADIGGKSPGGWCSDSTDVYQEGLRFDHVKLVEAGVMNEGLRKLIWDNVRLPLVTAGDFGAQLAACKTGLRRALEIYRRYGTDVVRNAAAEFFDQAEAALRSKIAEIPDGVYRAETFLDHDGVDRAHELRISLTLTVEGDAIRADFTGTDPQARGPVNCPLPAVVAGVESALKGLTMPLDRINSGHRRPLSVTAPEATVVNPRFPAAVDSYGFVYQMVAELVFRALAPVLPDRAPACGYPLFLIYFFSIARERAHDARSLAEGSFVYVDPPVGGSGAWAGGDGADALICLLDGDAPSPVAEMIEARYPLRLERYALNTRSGGPGKFRGGMGVIKEYVILEDGIYSQVSVEGTHHPAWGLNGGASAQPNGVVIWAGTEREQLLRDKMSFVGPFAAGDRVAACAGGGGGWGDPLERDPQTVLNDVLDEYCTAEDAYTDYGVVLSPDARGIDEGATAAERGRRPRGNAPA